MEETKVTIVVPVYQSKKNIRNCIKSILNQTYDNIELILVNDGSTDDSGIICEEFSCQNDNIKTIHQENKGVSAARNVGIQEATGEYLMFVDSDDFIAVSTLEKVMAIVKKFKVDIVFFDFIKLYSRKKNEVSSNISEGIYNKEKFAEVFLELFKTNVANNIGTKLYKTELITKNKIFFNEDYSIVEDITFCTEATSLSKTVYYLKEKLYFYNIHNEGSLMSSYKPNYYHAELDLFDRIKKYLINNGHFAKQRESYYDLYMKTILSVLINEIFYGKESIKLIAEITNDPKVKQSKKYIKKISFKKKFIYKLIWNKKKYLIYWIIKIKCLINKIRG